MSRFRWSADVTKIFVESYLGHQKSIGVCIVFRSLGDLLAACQIKYQFRGSMVEAAELGCGTTLKL